MDWCSKCQRKISACGCGSRAWDKHRARDERGAKATEWSRDRVVANQAPANQPRGLSRHDIAELRTMIANTPPDERRWPEEWLARALDDLESVHATLDDWTWSELAKDAPSGSAESYALRAVSNLNDHFTKPVG